MSCGYAPRSIFGRSHNCLRRKDQYSQQFGRAWKIDMLRSSKKLSFASPTRAASANDPCQKPQNPNPETRGSDSFLKRPALVFGTSPPETSVLQAAPHENPFFHIRAGLARLRPISRLQCQVGQRGPVPFRAGLVQNPVPPTQFWPTPCPPRPESAHSTAELW